MQQVWEVMLQEQQPQTRCSAIVRGVEVAITPESCCQESAAKKGIHAIWNCKVQKLQIGSCFMYAPSYV